MSDIRPEIPEPVQWVTYVGDCRGSIGNVMGPMYQSDQLLTVVEEHYDPDTNRTRLGLTYGVVEIPTPEKENAS